MSQSFEVKEIPVSVKDEMYAKGTITDEAPVPIERLRLVTVAYKDFEGRDQVGQIVVMDVLAFSVASIFEDLFEMSFPLDKMKLITAYAGSDDASMADNNTSAHNFRKVAGTSRLSLHAYGTAIDINPVQNPYILFEENSNQATYLPPNSIEFANRLTKRLGKPDQKGFAEEVVNVFARHGFYWWGGYWDTPIDYQHFQLDRDVSYILAAMDPEQASWFFQLLKNHFNEFGQPLESILANRLKGSLFEHYQEDPNRFSDWVLSNY